MPTVAPVQERTMPKKVGDPKNLNQKEENMSKKSVKGQKVITLRDTSAAMQHLQFSENFELVRKKKASSFAPFVRTSWRFQLRQFAAIIPFADGAPSFPMCKT